MTDLAHVEVVNQEVRTGRKAKSPKPLLQLEKYVDLEQVLPKLRRSIGHALGLNDFKMCGNNKLGNCTCAAVEHGVHIIKWQDKHGVDEAEVEQRAIDLYWATGDQDDGRYCTNVLGYVRQNGYGGDPHAVLGYVGVDSTNIELVCAAIDLLGGTYIGAALPLTAQYQTRTWTVNHRAPADMQEPGSWGGHCVWVQGYNHLAVDNSHLLGEFPLITWGERMYMTNEFWDMYVDESYGVLSQEWFNKLGKSPRGFDVAQLESDLKAIGK